MRARKSSQGHGQGGTPKSSLYTGSQAPQARRQDWSLTRKMGACCGGLLQGCLQAWTQPHLPTARNSNKGAHGPTGDRTGGTELQSCVLSHRKPGATRPTASLALFSPLHTVNNTGLYTRCTQAPPVTHTILIHSSNLILYFFTPVSLARHSWKPMTTSYSQTHSQSPAACSLSAGCKTDVYWWSRKHCWKLDGVGTFTCVTTGWEAWEGSLTYIFWAETNWQKRKGNKKIKVLKTTWK